MRWFIGPIAIIAAQPALAQGFCLPIDTIDVSGATIISDAQMAAAVAPFAGNCLGMEQINAALEAVTFLYVDRGYITARAYLPEQDIADRGLDITVVEGELAGIRFNGEARPLWEKIAFPGLIGQTANLRDIEQGLDIIRGMPAYTATMEITAGEAEGQSILDVDAVAEKRWTARFGANNHGTPGSGEYNATADLAYDHLLGLNETWSLNISRGAEANPLGSDTGGAATLNYGAGLRLPYGPWTLQGNYKHSYYETDTLGPITSIGTDGWTDTADISLSRVVHRNQNSKTSVTGVVNWRDNVNRIAEIEINASSRTLASARLDLDHERSLWGGHFAARLGYEQGLDAFDAEVAADPLVGPNPQFALVDFELRYSHGWAREGGNINASTTLRGQWSDDTLYGAYRMGLGSLSSVRGAKTYDYETSDAGLFSGDTGLIWRNDVSWTTPMPLPTLIGALQVYGGLDAGVVEVDDSDQAKPLVGGAVGLRTVGSTVAIDLAWQQVLTMPNGATPPDGIALLSISTNF
ncbi:ShlB/FhaC/HecB family hemolysin secretion/activation protein [Yoonia sp.]|uniref:ShlB/FhaC/HecB family hemolysin secretion/activation protein n=1 Tax=Yoonia sp. TaxID=2212373 RepID=UPI0025DB233C|nr:ShlB/FhaC/HecB family hemolysin secretion/activation protein [Yoonia sp.]